MQLKSGDLGEREYEQLRDKELIANSFSSTGKILFKKPTKTSGAETQPSTSGGGGGEGEGEEQKQEKITTELDTIFSLKEGKESSPVEGDGEETVKVVPKKKIYLEDEEKAAATSEAKRSRLVDRLAESKAACSLSASKVLAREAKSGNRKLLSFYDQEEEENEEYEEECLKEKLAKQDDDEEEDD